MNWPFRKRAASPPTSLDLALGIIEASLSSDPDAWEWTKHYARKDRVAVWVANQDYGLHVEFDGARITISDNWRRRIWRAVEPYLANGKVKDEATLAASISDCFRRQVEPNRKGVR